MNKDLENSLQEVPLSAVSDSLDRKVEAMIHQSEREGRRPSRRWVSLRAAALACVTCTVLGFVAHPLLLPPEKTRPAEPSVIYIENLPGDLPGVLGGGTSAGRTGFLDHKHSRVTDVTRG